MAGSQLQPRLVAFLEGQLRPVHQGLEQPVKVLVALQHRILDLEHKATIVADLEHQMETRAVALDLKKVWG